MNAIDRRSPRAWPSEGSVRVPYWVYTDPEIYAREQERIFGGPSWSFVGLAAEIPNPGDFKRTFVGDKPVVMVRDEEGGINCVVNRCAHRGVQFCREHRGNAKEFMCPYHQWTYDLQGSLTGVPFRRGVRGQGGMPADFRLEDHALTRLKAAERNGVVFAAFGDPEPFEDYLGPEILPWFDRTFDGRGLTILGVQRQLIPSNWKLMFENIKDPYHASLLHVFLVTFGLFRADAKSQAVMDSLGRHAAMISRRAETAEAADVADMKNFKSQLKLHDPKLLNHVREFPGNVTLVMLTIWPNLLVQQQSNTLAVRQIVPRGPDEFELNWTFFGYEGDSEELRQIRITQANLMGISGYVGVDDGEVLEFTQDGIRHFPDVAGIMEMGGRDEDSTDHVVTEAAIRAFYSHYRRVMEL